MRRSRDCGPRAGFTRADLIVAAVLAVRAGLRNVELTTEKPISTFGTSAAIAVVMTHTSNAVEPGPPHFEVTCSPVQIDSKPRRAPSCETSRVRFHALTGSQPSNSLK